MVYVIYVAWVSYVGRLHIRHINYIRHINNIKAKLPPAALLKLLKHPSAPKKGAWEAAFPRQAAVKRAKNGFSKGYLSS